MTTLDDQDEDLTTWRKELDAARAADVDHPPDDGAIVAVAPDEALLDVAFYAGYGHAAGPHVLIWTEHYVYFPVTYDGSEWLGRAPRDPQPEPQWHEGKE
jgi:hypothetical protein